MKLRSEGDIGTLYKRSACCDITVADFFTQSIPSHPSNGCAVPDHKSSVNGSRAHRGNVATVACESSHASDGVLMNCQKLRPLGCDASSGKGDYGS